MALSIINQRQDHPRTIKEKTLEYGRNGLALGIAAGIAEGTYRKSWLNNGKPNDTFEKQVIKNLEKTLSDDEYKELKKVQKFFYDITDPDVTVDSLKKQLINCDELKKAVTCNENETKEQAIERMFSEKDTNKLKDRLTNLQTKTTIDKKVDKKAAKELINKNFNKDKKTLEKAAEETEQMFKVLTKSKRHVKFNSTITDTLVAAFIGGVGGMLIGASSKNDKN